MHVKQSLISKQIRDEIRGSGLIKIPSFVMRSGGSQRPVILKLHLDVYLRIKQSELVMGEQNKIQPPRFVSDYYMYEYTVNKF